MFSKSKFENRKSKLETQNSKFEIRKSKIASGQRISPKFRVSIFGLRNAVCRWTVTAVTAFVAIMNTTVARAQSCAMCYNTAAAAKAAAIQALRSGILILLVPVAFLFIGIFILAFRSKERFTEFETRNSKFETGNSPPNREPVFAGEFRVSKRGERSWAG
jgi:hypothetical protein